jgi:hypothetical protein
MKVRRRSCGENRDTPACPARRRRTSSTLCAVIRRATIRPAWSIGQKSAPGSSPRTCSHAASAARLP